jgi:hypothetical protein
MTTAVNASTLVRGTLLGSLIAVMLLLAAPVPGEAQAGTDWRKCREQAYLDYNDCLMQEPNSLTHQLLCYFAWDLDNVNCDIQLIKDLLTF